MDNKTAVYFYSLISTRFVPFAIFVLQKVVFSHLGFHGVFEMVSLVVYFILS